MKRVDILMDGRTLMQRTTTRPEASRRLEEIRRELAPGIRVIRIEDRDEYRWQGEAPDDIADLFEGFERDDPLWGMATLNTWERMKAGI